MFTPTEPRQNYSNNTNLFNMYNQLYFPLRIKQRSVASFTKDVNLRLPKRTLQTNGRLAANLDLTLSKRSHW